MISKKDDAFFVSKSGVDMWIYQGVDEQGPAAVVYQETRHGHRDVFRHMKSTFIFYIIEGSGEWIIEDEVFPVSATDVVVVEPGKWFYYRGDLKQICITAPAWEAEFEEVR